MYCAIGVEPTKLIAGMSGWSRIASTASLSPLTTFKTPSGRPASLASSASSSAQDGSFSDGFSMNVLPQAMAIGYIHIGTIAGKLNGVMPAQTPSGCRVVHASMPRPTCSVYSPLRSCGMPHANSTTSSPRVREPPASDSTFPCSAVITAASRSELSSIKVLYLNMIRARVSGGVAAHSGKAAFAASTDALSSVVEASGTCAATSPVVGL